MELFSELSPLRLKTIQNYFVFICVHYGNLSFCPLRNIRQGPRDSSLAVYRKRAQVIRPLVQSQKTEKIDLNQEYTCPCRRRGQLTPITLTEAFGCDRCQQIFVVEENGYVLEQLSTTYPYKRAWRWTGNSWRAVQPQLGESYLPIALGIIFVLVIIWLPLALRLANGSSIIAWAMVAVLLAILPAVMVWLTYRR